MLNHEWPHKVCLEEKLHSEHSWKGLISRLLGYKTQQLAGHISKWHRLPATGVRTAESDLFLHTLKPFFRLGPAR